MEFKYSPQKKRKIQERQKKWSTASGLTTIAPNKLSYDGSAILLSAIRTRVCIPQKASQRFCETLEILLTSVKIDPEATRFTHASAISNSLSRESGHFV